MTGSFKLSLNPGQTLFLNVIINDSLYSSLSMEIYTIGQEYYETYLLNFAITVFSGTFGLFLFLVVT